MVVVCAGGGGLRLDQPRGGVPLPAERPKSILYQVVVVCVLTTLWDYWTGWHGWSIDYVIPITCVVAMLGAGDYRAGV